jgi:hypothetical protein
MATRIGGVWVEVVGQWLQDLLGSNSCGWRADSREYRAVEPPGCQAHHDNDRDDDDDLHLLAKVRHELQCSAVLP